MKHRLTPLPCSLFAALIICPLSLSALSAETEIQRVQLQPKLITPIRAVMPMSLHNSAIRDPRVIAKVQVSTNGRVQDMVVLEASHPDLIERAESLLRSALFDPGNISANESLRFNVNIAFSYPSDLMPGVLSVMDDVEITMNRVRNEDTVVRIYRPDQLDAVPEVVDNGKVYRPEDEEGNPIVGQARVQFYIDHRGLVRLPRVLSSTHDQVAIAAMETVSDMRFTPPTVDGRPALTLIAMPFNSQ